LVAGSTGDVQSGPSRWRMCRDLCSDSYSLT